MSPIDLKLRLEESYQELYGMRTTFRRTEQTANKAKVREAMMHLSACLDALDDITDAVDYSNKQEELL